MQGPVTMQATASVAPMAQAQAMEEEEQQHMTEPMTTVQGTVGETPMAAEEQHQPEMGRILGKGPKAACQKRNTLSLQPCNVVVPLASASTATSLVESIKIVLQLSARQQGALRVVAYEIR